jgi:hypothetical protein
MPRKPCCLAYCWHSVEAHFETGPHEACRFAGTINARIHDVRALVAPQEGGSARLPRSGVVEVVMNTSSKLRFVAAAAALSLVCASPASARDANSKEASADLGIGVVTALANVVYMPVKLTYGVMGGITGGLAYVLSGANRDVAEGVWVPSMGGDYVLTTDHMTGREQVHFNGVREENAFQSARSSDEALGEGAESGF